MEYKFDNCLFDPTKIEKKKKVQETYPELLPYKEYHNCKNTDWQIGMCITDLSSPFIKIKDHKQRVDAVFDYFGFDKHKGDMSEDYSNIIGYKACGIIDVCTFMLEYQNNHDFAAWWIKNKSYYSLLEQISKPMQEGDREDNYWDRKFKNEDRASRLVGELKTLEANLFGSSAMKGAVARSKQKLERNYAEKYAVKNQTE